MNHYRPKSRDLYNLIVISNLSLCENSAKGKVDTSARYSKMATRFGIVKMVYDDQASTHNESYPLNPLPDDKILDRSKLKQSADDNFKFDENSRKFSKRVENIVGKGEIARYEQSLLFPQCFQKSCFPGASKGVTVWEWVKTIETNHLAT